MEIILHLLAYPLSIIIPIMIIYLSSIYNYN